MTLSWLLDNLLAWSAQVAVLVAFAALAALTLKNPRARLLFWQGILVLAILLPAIEPWTHMVDGSANGVALMSAPILVTHHAFSRPIFVWRREYLLAIALGGALLRMLWIAVGFLRLRRHRLAARILGHPPVPFESAHVLWYLSDTVSGPVTFGWLRPSILLPSRINELSDALREAIACHELVHVRRRDWLFVIGEEMLRAVLWFHPAIWFVLSQVQLAREQTVDLEVIGLTRDRERYLDALIAVAAQKIGYRGADVAPAPLFLKNRQLASRVAAVLKENRMSKARMLGGLTSACSAVVAAACVAMWFFPLQTPAQGAPQPASALMGDDPAITIDPGGTLMHRTPVSRAPGVTATGTVVVDASIDSKGEVTDARVVSGPEELRSAVLRSVLQWHYSSEGTSPTVHVTVQFGPVLSSSTSVVRLVTQDVLRAQPASIVKTINFVGVPAEVEQKVRGLLPVHEGDSLSSDSLQRILAAAQQVDEHFRGTVAINNAHEATITLELGWPGMAAPVKEGVGRGIGTGIGGGVEATAAAAPPQRIRVGGNVQAANLVLKVTPPYPSDAKQARIQGVVQLTAIINKDGTIQSLQLISGHPLLVPAATDAVKQWVYRPTLLNGNPVEVITQIDVNFTLTQ